jgi:hypothetical protein
VTGTSEIPATVNSNQEHPAVNDDNQGDHPEEEEEDDIPEEIPRFRARGFAATTSTSTRASVVSATGVVRRVRHAEIVLVDDVCIAYGRYWLRLRWPGHKGGFAGYIAMGRIANGGGDWPSGENQERNEGRKFNFAGSPLYSCFPISL